MTNKKKFVCLDWLLLWVCAYMFDWLIFFLEAWSSLLKQILDSAYDSCMILSMICELLEKSFINFFFKKNLLCYIYIFYIKHFDSLSNPFTLRIHSALSFAKMLSGNRLPQYVIDYNESG